MQLKIDQDIQAVLEFMQKNIATSKLVGVAEKLPALAIGLWFHHVQEPFRSMSLEVEQPTAIKTSCETQLVSTV